MGLRASLSASVSNTMLDLLARKPSSCDFKNAFFIVLVNHVGIAFGASPTLASFQEKIIPPGKYTTLREKGTLYKSELGVLVHEFGHSFGGLEDEYVDHELGGFGRRNINCFTAESEKECLENAPWKDLVGMCFADSCDSLTVGCFEGCAGSATGVYRPTLASIMLDGGTQVYSFGLVNERELCKKIKERTGLVEGYCSNFN